jgi:hypothetical protein
VRGALATVEVRALGRRHRARAARARERAGAAVARAARLTVATAGRVGRAAAAARTAQACGTLAGRRAADLFVATTGLAATADTHRARAALVTGAARAAVATAVHLGQRAHAALAEEIAAALGARATRRALKRAAGAADAVRTATAVLGLLARDARSGHRTAQVRLAATPRRAGPEIAAAGLPHIAAHGRRARVGAERIVARERVGPLLGRVEAAARIASFETTASIRTAEPERREGDEDERTKPGRGHRSTIARAVRDHRVLGDGLDNRERASQASLA